MKLLRLEVQGFKSFKDRTIIQFDEGITGIVGPNGCGKSNIVDALFWVMGEQSAKHLRGNKMKDLIFAGSSKYSPAAWAEVTLVLQNDTGKHIHINNQLTKPSEIALTRKLYRNGETEYKINGEFARLKDIHEVFMDTGAGAKSYSIIAQGEINKLVQAKPIERMAMIEEVAGITKFKIRKRESLKKIENTQANLLRLTDLKTEIGKNLKSLKEQAEKAEQAKKLQEKIKKYDLRLKAHEEFDKLSEILETEERTAQDTTRKEELEVQINQKEMANSDDLIQKDELKEKIDLLQARYNEQSKELAAKEERVIHVEQAVEKAHKRQQELTEEIDSLEHDLVGRREKLLDIEGKIEEIGNFEADDNDIEEKEEIYEGLQANLEEREEELRTLQVKLNQKKDELASKEKEEFQIQSSLRNISENLQEIAKEIEEIEINYADHHQKLQNQKAELTTKNEELQKSLALQKELETKKETNLNELKALKLEQRASEKELIQMQASLSSLEAINASMATYEGAKDFVKDKNAEEVAILGDLLESEEAYAKAIERFLGDKLSHLIFKNDDSIFSQDELSVASTWVDGSMQESALSSDDIAERFQVKGFGGVTKATDVVKFKNEGFKSEVSPLFTGVYFVDEFASNLNPKELKDFKFRAIVSKDGKKIIHKLYGELISESFSEDHQVDGIVERNNKIKELTLKIQESTSSNAEQLSKLETLEKTEEQLESEYREIKKTCDQIKAEVIELRSIVNTSENGFGASSARIKILNDKKQELSNKKIELLEKEESFGSTMDVLVEEKELFEEELEEAAQEIAQYKTKRDQAHQDFLIAKTNLESHAEKLESWTSQKEDIESQIESMTRKLEKNTTLIDEAKEQIEADRLEVTTLKAGNQEEAENLQEQEEQISVFKDEFHQLANKLQVVEDELKKARKELSDVEKRLFVSETKVAQLIEDEEILVRDYWERYKINFRKVIARFMEKSLDNMTMLKEFTIEEGQEEEEYNFVKMAPYQLKESREKFKKSQQELNRLGNVNWDADIEYEKQKLRFDFLQSQEDQLNTSLEELHKAISHIDNKSKGRFQLAFDEVNTRFSRVFPIIFGGGEARLEIVGDIESDDCGIDIIAKPPGKKMQSINLMSGGEKAMTAVSLIFSIFLVKPSPFCLLDEVDAPLDDANVGRFNELLREMSSESQFILITHNKKTMELNDTLYGVTMQEPGVSKAVSVRLQSDNLPQELMETGAQLQ